ncbi:MAG TPA: VOC family protein [Gemmatimonadales bacterium]|jgi:uncharacterized glyoxalase superfamily protein PhnB
MATKTKKPKKPAKPKEKLPARRQPETLRLRGISLSLTATDLRRSIAFYRDVLGFMVGEEWRENGALAGAELKAGAVNVMVTQDDFAKGRDRLKGVGFRIRCHTTQDIDRFAAQIKERGGMLDQEPKDMPWGERIFQITDPDGFKLSFVQAR